MTRLSIASNPNSGTHIEAVLRRRSGSSELYLALESGPKTQEELARLLGTSQPTVSKILGYLHESGLIEKLAESGRILWMWYEMERTLGISRVARRLAIAKSTPKAGIS
jgi:CRP-like cAMP-binding protein